ncbi:MAG TPA: hypothetical protein VFO67_00105 [Gemmatimonadales bacterium]|nr:hypothetical protein [Gemmatimonadales bacterium]
MSTKDAPPDFDAAKAEAFAERLLTALNHGALCLTLSIGHRTGLLDVMSGMPPAASDEIAEEGSSRRALRPRWLSAMATAGVVAFDPATKKFSLPAEHAAFLTRAAGSDNMAVYSQYVPVLTTVEEDIIDSFRNGGGVPYSRYSRFHEVMAEDSAQSVFVLPRVHTSCRSCRV